MNELLLSSSRSRRAVSCLQAYAVLCSRARGGVGVGVRERSTLIAKADRCQSCRLYDSELCKHGCCQACRIRPYSIYTAHNGHKP